MTSFGQSATAPLRVVHVLRAPVGGLFRHVADLAREQSARGHRVGLIVDQLTGGERADDQLRRLEPSLSLGLLRAPMRRSPHVTDAAALARVSRRLRALSPDIVHGHGSKGGLYARLSRLWPGASRAARLYTPHGGSLNYLPGTSSHRLFMLVEHLLGSFTDAFLFESAYIDRRYRELVGAPATLARIVPNGVAAAEFEPVTLSPEAAEFFYIGEFRSVKGLDTLIDALALLSEKTGKRPRLVLIGDGPDKNVLIARAQDRGVGEQLSVLGPMSARQAFSLGRTMIVPSRAESLPYVVLEAAAAQAPLIATNVGGVPEIFGPFASRLIPCDDPSALCEAMANALDEPLEQKTAKAIALSNLVRERFSLEAMVDGVIDAYREALAARAGG